MSAAEAPGDRTGCWLGIVDGRMVTVVIERNAAKVGCWIWCMYGARETVDAVCLRSPGHCQMLTAHALGRD